MYLWFYCYLCTAFGRLAEWSNALDSKSGIPLSGIGGLNPSSSASILTSQKECSAWQRQTIIAVRLTFYSDFCFLFASTPLTYKLTKTQQLPNTATHQLTNSKSHKPINSHPHQHLDTHQLISSSTYQLISTHKITQSPTYKLISTLKLTNSPNHQLKNSPTHQLKNLNSYL